MPSVGGDRHEPRVRQRRRRGRVRALVSALHVEAAAQQQAVQDRERWDQQHRADRGRDHERDERRAARRGLVDREARQHVGSLSEHPADEHGCHGRRGRRAGRAVAAHPDEHHRRPTRERRDDDRAEAPAAGQPVPDRPRVIADDEQPRHRDRARRDAHPERAHAERLCQRPLAEPHRVGRQVHRGQVRGDGHGKHAHEERRPVHPARERVALRVADRHAARGDAADRGAEGERDDDRREREHQVDRAQLAPGPRPDAQSVGGAAQDDPDRRDEERHRERRHDRGERRRVARPADDEHEDQPDVIRLPDRPHGVVRVVAHGLPALVARAGQQRPEPCAEVGAAEHAVRRQAGDDQDQRIGVKRHLHLRPRLGGP
jgi:hypothetical protein